MDEELERHALAVSFGTLKDPATARARPTLACISRYTVCLLTCALYPHRCRPRVRDGARGSRRSRAPSWPTSRAAQDAVRRAARRRACQARGRALMGPSVAPLWDPLK